jgi:16S rRNA (uracil1498-N3)-methyltransferase
MRTLLAPAPLVPGAVMIDGDEAHHGRTVLRLSAGDPVRLADGARRAGAGVVAEVGRHRLVVTLERVEELVPDPAEAITVAVAAPKGDRFTDLVRQLTELGVGAILPLACERGERIPGLDRAHRVAAEALKQCRRATLPRIGPVVDFPTLATLPGRRIVLDREGSPANPGTPGPTVLIIGPEGGFTPAERSALLAMPSSLVRLAGPVLRIETAAIAAAAVWSAAWEGTRP